jgi:hypothetical protein
MSSITRETVTVYIVRFISDRHPTRVDCAVDRCLSRGTSGRRATELVVDALWDHERDVVLASESFERGVFVVLLASTGNEQTRIRYPGY